ncbi:MAG: hypothetical protein HY307_01825 [Arcobacter sp.]|nr:hypothetical protein [Arcobacter sp.]
MKNIALISNTEIINKIFTLIANKLMVNLKIYRTANIVQNVDLIIVDDFFLNENIIKLRANCDTLVILKNDSQPESNFDFVIEKPFLPSTLSVNLEKILKNIEQNSIPTHHQSNISKENISSYQNLENNQTIYKSSEPTNEEITNDLSSFISNMIDEIDEEKHYNSDDLTVTKEQLGHGGVLDKDELSKLYDMINDDSSSGDFLKNTEQKDDWIELSDIIDQAIDDLATYNFKENKPIKLILNQYSMDELSPLLKQLNQNIIDSLSDGNEITLQLRLEK